jgi:hypothetical protein
MPVMGSRAPWRAGLSAGNHFAHSSVMSSDGCHQGFLSLATGGRFQAPVAGIHSRDKIALVSTNWRHSWLLGFVSQLPRL